MKIDRQKLVSRHCPILEQMDVNSPLTVGNGEFAFTADITGLQTLYQEYQDTCPLCTMSQWGWHTQPVSSERYSYTLDDLVMTEFEGNGRKLVFPKNPKPGNEAVYDWLRKNPHRLNLGRIGFTYKDREIAGEELRAIHQKLDLYAGILESSFTLANQTCAVDTMCDSQSDTLGIHAVSDLFQTGDLKIVLSFPYGSPAISASDWNQENRHSTILLQRDGNVYLWKRVLDRDTYYVKLSVEGDAQVQLNGHCITVQIPGKELNMTVQFLAQEPETLTSPALRQLWSNTEAYWKNFWETGSMVQLHNSPDPRAEELERRIILSMYLMAVNSSGSTPPQETGLTCNSWYGKMHLEMYFWHCAWGPLWGRTFLLERSLPWYLNHMEEARENAARNQYKGCRWPKMIATEGIDCPSKVAPMLIWQQPHIIFMLELAYRDKPDRNFLKIYWPLIQETAEFMVDLAVYNEEKKCYELTAPVIPVQECHRSEETLNPAFEVAYWKYTLEIAVKWGERLQKECNPKWQEVAENMTGLAQLDGLYLAHEKCPATFTEFNHDHPSMLMACGVLPQDEKLDGEVMRNTLHKVLECWNYPSLWGWDFAVMAMTAARLGEPETAIDILLKDTPKNDYVASGNNRQILRKDLPLYLPGNGSLLLAIPMMAAGFAGSEAKHPGFPENWVVETEDMQEYV